MARLLERGTGGVDERAVHLRVGGHELALDTRGGGPQPALQVRLVPERPAADARQRQRGRVARVDVEAAVALAERGDELAVERGVGPADALLARRALVLRGALARP